MVGKHSNMHFFDPEATRLEVEGVQSIGRNMSVSLGRILALAAGRSRGEKPFIFITD